MPINAFVGSVLGSAGGKLVDSIFGPDDKSGQVLEQIRLGNSLDLSNQKQMFDYRINRGLESGMTPYEMFMGPAASGGGGTTGSGQVLGNTLNQKQMLAKQQQQEFKQKAADRITALMQTEMQTNAQVKTAEISAGATLGSAGISADVTRYTAELKNRIDQGRLDLSEKEFEQVTLPAAMANIGKTKQETLKLIEDTATSTPKFKRSQTLLSMGVENSVNTMLQKRFGINIASDEDMAKLNEKQFRNVLAVFIAAGSKVNQEFQGLLSAVPGNQSQFNLNPLNGVRDPNNKPPTLGKPNRWDYP